MPTARQWDYAPLKGRIISNAATLAAAAVYGSGLAMIFNPLAAGLAVAYGVGRTAYGYAHSGPAIVPEWIKKGYLRPLPPQYAHVQSIADQMTTVMGMAPAKVFILRSRQLYDEAPWYDRKHLRNKNTLRRVMRGQGMALSTANFIALSEDMIKKAGPAELRFVIAHELAHVRNSDSSTPRAIFGVIKKVMQRALWPVLLTASAAGLFGFGGIVTPGGAHTTSAGILLAAIKPLGALALTTGVVNLLTNCASLMMERRADRNAMYLTRDMQGAADFLIAPEKETQPVRMPAILELLSTHPSYYRRRDNLRQAWEEAATYPVPPTSVRNIAREEEPKPAAKTRSLWELPPHLRQG